MQLIGPCHLHSVCKQAIKAACLRLAAKAAIGFGMFNYICQKSILQCSAAQQ